MYLWRLLKTANPSAFDRAVPLFVILVQVFASLVIMVKGAHIFVQSLEQISVRFGMDPLLFTLLVAPFATELPEKFNSITWTWKGRDTLAMGNITGAMVFQSTFPVSVGLLFTGWNVTGMALFSAILAMMSAAIILGTVIVMKRISPVTMLFSGCLYLVYVTVVVLR